MISIRRMREEDVEQAALLEKGIFSQPWSAQGFLDALRIPHTIFLVADAGDKIAGYLGMYCTMGEGEITNVAVAPDWRRRGVGQLLMEAAEEAARNDGIARIVLEVRVSNESAIRLYSRNGFGRCGVRKGFYDFPKEDAVIMVKFL